MVSLRPVGCHGALRRAAARAGARTVALSPWRLQARTDPAARMALCAALEAESVLFTSPAAVRAAAALTALRAQRGQAWYAVGAETARALQRVGIRRVHAPAQASSESLLAMPGLTQARGHRIGLVTAPDGRELLARTLAERGMQLQLAHVYTRQRLVPAPAAVFRLTKMAGPLWIALSSGQALTHVLDTLPTRARQRLLRARVSAASERLATLGHELGFRRMVVATGPQPSALVAAMVQAYRGD